MWYNYNQAKPEPNVNVYTGDNFNCAQAVPLSDLEPNLSKFKMDLP